MADGPGSVPSGGVVPTTSEPPSRVEDRDKNFFEEFFEKTSVNWRVAVDSAALIFADFTDNINKRLAYSLGKLKEANKELRILGKAQQTIKNFESKARQWSAGLNDDGEASTNVVITNNYKVNPHEAGNNDANNSDKWSYKRFGSDDPDGGTEVFFSDAEIRAFQKAIAAIKYYSRDAESGEISAKAGEDNLNAIFGDDGSNYVVDLDALEKALSTIDNMVEALSPLTNRLSQESQTVSAKVQQSTTATSQWIDVAKIIILPFFQK